MIVALRCDWPQAPELPQVEGEELKVVDVAEVPSRKELKFLDAIAQQFLVSDTESLDDIAARPDVAHQGEPAPAPQALRERVRVIVQGTDAAVAAVATKLMRIDAMWIELAAVPRPSEETVASGKNPQPLSPIATVWGLPSSPIEAAELAVHGDSVPTAVIRDDHGVVTLGRAEITGPNPEKDMVGEVIVDSEVVPSRWGVRWVPTGAAPGLAAASMDQPQSRTWWGRLRSAVRGQQRREHRVWQGRALQAGGVDLRVTRDGVPHSRPLKAITFYRHLRDGQFVRR